jgi:hypothetical protein
VRRAVATAVIALAVCAGPAGAELTRSQVFFAQKLQADKKTSPRIKELLRSGGYVDRSVAFRDLNRDKKPDAVVRVQTGGASGAVAVYVFSTAGAKELRVVFRSENLTRASTKVVDGVLSYRNSRYAPGDELCCPAQVTETTLKWVKSESRFRVDKRTELTPEPAATPTPTATPAAG